MKGQSLFPKRNFSSFYLQAQLRKKKSKWDKTSMKQSHEGFKDLVVS